jgi:hypothetical protein
MEEALHDHKFRKRFDGIFFGSLFILGLFLAYNFNVKNGKVPTPGVFYVDKASYYVYLPFTFIYGFDAQNFPINIDKKTRGFTLDLKHDKLVAKTTCGIAILWSPFFLLTHAIARVFHLQADGFSDFYAKMTILPAVFYLVLGLFFLKKFLEKYEDRVISYLTIILIFLGTNLYFYSIKDGLMSHDTTFFLVAFLLFLLKTFLDNGKKPFHLFILMCVVTSFIVLIRPTGILVLLFFLFLDVRTWQEAGNRLLFFLRPRYSLTFILIFILVFSPQLIYWHYLTGKFLYYSYPGEGFDNWKFPMMIPIWVSPLNGLFLYNPLALLFIAGGIIMIIKRIPNGIFITSFFLLLSYIFSSWYSWYYGGGSGSRPFIDFYPLLAIPFANSLVFIRERKNLFIRSGICILILFSVYYNIRMMYGGGNTFSGSTWSWDDFLIELKGANIYKYQKTSYTFIQDFENHMYDIPEPATRECVHTLALATYLDSTIIISCRYTWRLEDILVKPVRQADVTLWIYPVKNDKTGASLVYSIEDEMNISHYSGIRNFDYVTTRSGQWNKIHTIIDIPDRIDQYCKIIFFICNNKKTKFFLDDLTIKFE